MIIYFGHVPRRFKFLNLRARSEKYLKKEEEEAINFARFFTGLSDRFSVLHVTSSLDG